MIIVNKVNTGQQQYNFYVSRGRVHEALQYKISYEPYYKDVELDELALTSLPINPTNISDLLYATTSYPDPIDLSSMQEDVTEDDPLIENLQMINSFVANLPPARREIKEIRSLLQLEKGHPTHIVQWPPISPSPINEYTTEGLFVMSFPTLFPKGIAAFKQQRLKEVKLHEYALHLLRYHDNRFGQHPRFRYFILNILMHHRSQATASLFFHKQLDDSMPTTISDLHHRLKDLPDDKLADQLMRFSLSNRGTKPFWNQRRGELIDMVIQIGCPTLFFTLSALDTKWPDLHDIMPSTTPTNPYATARWRLQNIVQNPHLTAMYMHHRFTAFGEEVLEKLLGANDYWYRYEWQHRGSAHIHGFLWLPQAPDIGKLQCNNIQSVQNTLAYIDKYVSAWNPRSLELRNQVFHRSIVDDPCLMDTSMIVSSDPSIHYYELANHVQRHTKCTIQTCLCRKGTSLVCHYKAPWSIKEKSSLSNDANGQPTYTPARNDDRLDLHNPFILSIWRANVDCQPVLSIHAVIKYIAKYAAKAKNKSKTYHAMLSRISTNFESDKPAPNAFRKMLLDNLVDRDIGAQESCHLLLKLPLSICSRTFFSLNVNKKKFQRVPITSTDTTTYPNYITSYMARPIQLERMSLIEVTQKWSFNASRKHDQWKERATPVIVRVSPRFTTIPAEEEKSYQAFCWSELLLYHPFRNIAMDFGSTDDEIQGQWQRFLHNYNPWHVHCTPPEVDEKSNTSTPSSDAEQMPKSILNECLQPPLKIIVQGTADTGKSHLIKSIKSTLTRSAPTGQSPLLLLAPTGVAAFNIQASTIHSTLRIPIKEMFPLQGQILASFQESMYFIRYIIIDEMSFIGPKLIQRIDIRLREAFPAHNQLQFGGRSIILFGDLGQLPPVKDIPMYASTSYGGTLWRSFITVITLKKTFRQTGEQPTQIAFRALLSNL
ncbi:uncharacterized protein LOC131028544 [Cryptomeria japonica]|uniref:uncharacterized protein LOC131028544 n=1 Tax=Cryptomeria japonica TaxID=3369 RepID=UPI0027D9FBA4|nr:uncharacterized protein LOC131028544 [Cryptomeria japonica]